MRSLTRRSFIWTGTVFAVLSSSAVAGEKRLPRVIRPTINMNHVRTVPKSLYEMDLGPDLPELDPDQLPPPESDVDYPIIPASAGIPPQFRAQTVNLPGITLPGAILVDPAAHFLYLINGDGTARRYGVGVGREGFAWAGSAVIGMKRRWPRWVPPRDMVRRDRKARRWANGQPGGPGNPLGARALYLHQDGQDTLYRIHGTNEPQSIGKSVSSGCIRMLNEHIAELYDLVSIGTPVIVLPTEDSMRIVETSG